ncbi:pentapeptide repeat-containing protein [Rickettsiales endosymbiont of Stachyamoeba lipophora]|uniref:pentapeptide repeat-containing protein n=1 Tax=Rickettsiales endosymbiont of Stachyamoeba lipophora TaxID=2486578 RepID=UPI000F64DEF1|nr:pentapeptide repeat-containing protein [Rickettsiales endosymbiont of Stachyamoeba lipophora]AZL16129.1 hypothetical protein EF513_06245 [Rickettsiales endosymbiont of Stachyamoeba lipophora]
MQPQITPPIIPITNTSKPSINHIIDLYFQSTANGKVNQATTNLKSFIEEQLNLTQQVSFYEESAPDNAIVAKLTTKTLSNINNKIAKSLHIQQQSLLQLKKQIQTAYKSITELSFITEQQTTEELIDYLPKMLNKEANNITDHEQKLLSLLEREQSLITRIKHNNNTFKEVTGFKAHAINYGKNDIEITNYDFSKHNLNKHNLSGLTLIGCTFGPIDNTNFQESVFNGCNFNGSFDQCDLKGSKFINSLSKIQLNDCKFALAAPHIYTPPEQWIAAEERIPIFELIKLLIKDPTAMNTSAEYNDILRSYFVIICEKLLFSLTGSISPEVKKYFKIQFPALNKTNFLDEWKKYLDPIYELNVNEDLQVFDLPTAYSLELREIYYQIRAKYFYEYLEYVAQQVQANGLYKLKENYNTLLTQKVKNIEQLTQAYKTKLKEHQEFEQNLQIHLSAKPETKSEAYKNSLQENLRLAKQSIKVLGQELMYTKRSLTTLTNNFKAEIEEKRPQSFKSFVLKQMFNGVQVAKLLQEKGINLDNMMIDLAGMATISPHNLENPHYKLDFGDFSDCDFRNFLGEEEEDLLGIKFHRSILSHANFSSVGNYFTAIKRKLNWGFTPTHFSLCDIKHSNLNHAQFFGSKIFGNEIQNSSLLDADFSECQFIATNIEACNLEHTNFAKSKHFATIFEKSKLLATNFKKAQFIETLFNRSQLTAVNFTEATSILSQFSNLRLTECDFEHYQSFKDSYDKCKSIHSNFQNCNFNYSSLSSFISKNDDFTKAELNLEKIVFTQFMDIKCNEAKLAAQKLQKTIIRNGRIKGLKLDFKEIIDYFVFIPAIEEIENENIRSIEVSTQTKLGHFICSNIVFKSLKISQAEHQHKMLAKLNRQIYDQVSSNHRKIIKLKYPEMYFVYVILKRFTGFLDNIEHRLHRSFVLSWLFASRVHILVLNTPEQRQFINLGRFSLLREVKNTPPATCSILGIKLNTSLKDLPEHICEKLTNLLYHFELTNFLIMVVTLFATCTIADYFILKLPVLIFSKASSFFTITNFATTYLSAITTPFIFIAKNVLGLPLILETAKLTLVCSITVVLSAIILHKLSHYKIITPKTLPKQKNHQQIKLLEQANEKLQRDKEAISDQKIEIESRKAILIAEYQNIKSDQTQSMQFVGLENAELDNTYQLPKSILAIINRYNNKKDYLTEPGDAPEHISEGNNPLYANLLKKATQESSSLRNLISRAQEISIPR